MMSGNSQVRRSRALDATERNLKAKSRVASTGTGMEHKELGILHTETDEKYFTLIYNESEELGEIRIRRERED